MPSRLICALSAALAAVTACKPDNKAAVKQVESSPANGSEATNSWDLAAVPGMPDTSGLSARPFDSDKLTQVLVPAADRIPEKYWGIWWTDGDTLPIVALTLNNAVYDKNNSVMYLPVYGPQSYTYRGGYFTSDKDAIGHSIGEGFFHLMQDLRLIYEIKVTDDGSTPPTATIVPIVTIYGHTVRVPTWMAEFTMHFVRDGLWNRESKFFGIPVMDYKFTRVIKPDGTPDQANNNAFDRYKEWAGAQSLVICSSNKELQTLACKN